MPSDEQLMRDALRLAKRARGETSPNPLVGAVLAKRGNIIGRGWHRRAGLPHAEVEAIADAKRKGNPTKGATLYVTLEPCAMCAGAIIHARIKRVVFATHDPRGGAAGSVFDILVNDQLNHRVNTTSGILQAEAANQLKTFFKARR